MSWEGQLPTPTVLIERGHCSWGHYYSSFSGVHWGAESQDRMRGAARRPADERVCMHCEAAGQPGLVEDTKHMVFTCSLYSGVRCSYPHLFTRLPPREVPLLAQSAAGPPQLHPPSQLAQHLWIPPPASPPHQLCRSQITSHSLTGCNDNTSSKNGPLVRRGGAIYRPAGEQNITNEREQNKGLRSVLAPDGGCGARWRERAPAGSWLLQRRMRV